MKIRETTKTRMKWGPALCYLYLCIRVRMLRNLSRTKIRSRNNGKRKIFRVCARYARSSQIDSGIRVIMAIWCLFVYTSAIGRQAVRHTYMQSVLYKHTWKSYFKLTARKFFCAPACTRLFAMTSDDIRSFYQLVIWRYLSLLSGIIIKCGRIYISFYCCCNFTHFFLLVSVSDSLSHSVFFSLQNRELKLFSFILVMSHWVSNLV